MSAISVQSTRRGKRRNRLPLLTSSALIAIAAGASIAHGQAAFQGTPTFSAGNVSYSAAGNNTDVFTLSSHSAIIDWTPTDNQGSGTINFLPAGKTGVFQSSTDANFTVLNRINPADTNRPVEFDGHVVSQYINAAGAASRGGNVWFYTPGGIIVGATGVFDVGSLILTTNAIDTSNGVPSPGGGIKFRGASGSLSNITVQPGAQINATNPGSYVALVAPRINQGGTVNVNGSAGYVAAEAADITINAGLFAITNTIGSQVAPGGETTLTHTGTTTGAAATATGSPHNIYMVAIPKNDAVTMLVAGNVGYQAATTANVVNGTIVLGAGYTNNSGAFDPARQQDSVVTALGSGKASTVTLGAGTYSSAIYAYSNGTFGISAAQGDIVAGAIYGTADRHTALDVTNGHSIAAGDIGLYNFVTHPGLATSAITVASGGTLTAGNLTAQAVNGQNSAGSNSVSMTVSGTATVNSVALVSDTDGIGTQPVVAGSSTLTVDGGALTVTQATPLPAPFLGVYISAEAYGGASGTSSVGDTTGGTARFAVIDGGRASLGNVTLSALADSEGGLGGAISGGSATLTATSGGTMTIAGAVSVGAGASGTADASHAASVAGGSATIVADGGTIGATGATSSLLVGADANGGSAAGGVARVSTANSGTIRLAGGLNLDASASNGNGATAAARGGTALLSADTRSVIGVSGTTNLTALGDSSTVTAGAAAGYDALGGTASVTSANGAAVTFGTQLMLGADATGAQDASVTSGSATAGSVTIQTFSAAITMPSFYAEAIARANPGATDAATLSQGGTGRVEAQGGSITLTDATANSSVELGARGGIATGGVANLRARLGGTIAVAGGMALHSDAAGGARTDADAAGYAGTGGSASVTANGGTLNLASLDVSANGYGGDGVAGGGNGLGGYAVLQAGPGGSIHDTGVTYLNATGQGGAGGTGTANGTGGTSAVYANGSTITLDDALGVMSTGNGAAALAIGRDPATQGIGQGGTSSLAADGGGTITLKGATVDATGQGGAGAGGGVGGTGIGGTATFETGRDGQVGNVTAQLLYVRSEGKGGAPDATAGGDGGLGKGGLAQFSVGTGTVDAATLLVASSGTGSDGVIEASRVTGPSGGDAAGGNAIVSVLGGTLAVQSGEIYTGATAGAGAAGENGGSGGNASGGIAQMQITGGALSGGDWEVFETAQGGVGGSGSAGAGGLGGRGDAGGIAMTISGGTASINSLSATLTGIGGVGGTGGAVTVGSSAIQNGQAGGAGGAATSGAASLVSGNGSFTTSGNLTLANAAFGGTGGVGGGGTGTGGLGGVGGQGGDAKVGTVSLVALGGTIGSSRSTITTNPVAGFGGSGGLDGTDVAAASGATGGDIGGTATIESDNQGLLSLGDTSVDVRIANAESGAGGSVDLLALNSSGGTAPLSAITMASLTVTNNEPAISTGSGQFTIQAAAPIAVTGDASFTGVGNTGFSFSGTGGLTVGGALSISAASISGAQTDAGLPTISAGSASLTATTGGLTLDNLTTTTGDLALDSAGTLTVGSLRAAGSLTADSAADLTIGTAIAALDLTIQAQTSVDVTTATAGRDAALLTTVGDGDTSIRPRGVTIGSLTAGDDAVVTAWGGISIGTITTTGLGEDGTDSTTYGNLPGSSVKLVSGDALHVQSINTIGNVTAEDSAESINGVQQAAGTGGVTLDSVTTQGTVSATSQFDFVSLSNVTASSVSASGKSVSIASPGALTVTAATSSAGDITIQAAGALDLTAAPLSATGGNIALTSGGALGFGTMTADGSITINATGALTGTSQTANAGTIEDTAGGLVDIGAIGAGFLVSVNAGGGGHFGTLAAGTDAAVNDGSLDFGSIGIRTAGDIVLDASPTVAGSIGLLSSAGGITAPALTAGPGGGVVALAAGPITLGAVTAPGLFYLGGPAALAGLGADPTTAQIYGLLSAAGPSASGADVTIGATQVGSATIAAGTTLALTGAFSTTTGNALLSAGGNVTAGDVTGFGALSAASTGGSVTLGNVAAGNPTGGGITLTGSGAVTAGNLTGAGSIAASSSGGAVTLGQVTSSGGAARITASGAIVTGDVTAAGSIYLTGGAAITAGNLKAGVGTLLASEAGSGAGGGTDAAPDGIATGFDQNIVGSCDDCSTSAITLPFDVNYFGNDYSSTYVSNNGYFTFNYGQGTYTPSGLGSGYSGQGIIAAFFADVDTRGAGTVTYGTGTFAGRQAFAATWNGVGYYGAHTDKLNTFQIVLANRADTGTGNFDIYYNYGNIGWETGDASGGSGGFGGVPAAVGFNAGTGNQAGTFFQLPGSLVTGSFTNGGTAPLITTTNDGNPGQLLFSVRNGLVAVGGPSEPPTVHVSNVAAGNTADIRLGNISGEAAEVHGAGYVTVGNVTVADQHSGIAATGNPFATVLDASNGLIAGDISGAGFVAIGAAQGDISTGTIASGSSVAVLGDGAIALGSVTTGQTAADTLFVSGNAAQANLTGFAYTTLLNGHGFDPATLATATATATGGNVAIGGPVSAGNVTVAAGGAFTSGGIAATGTATLTGASITVGGPLSAATLVANASGAFASGAVATSGDAAITAGSIAVDGTIGAANLTATSGGAFTSGAIGATGTATLTGASIAVGGPLSAATLVANASGAFASGAVATTGDAAITAGSIAVDGTIGAANLTATSGGAFTSGGITATGNATLAGNGITVGGPVSAATLTATSSGAFTSGAIATTGDAAIGGTAVTVGGATAGGALALVANGALTLQGDVDAATIALTSHDLAAAGQIGSGRTTALTFTNSGGGATYVGAAGATASDYDLSAGELGNAHAASIAILAPGTASGPADILLGDLTLSNANLVGAGGNLSFTASGTIRLGGHLVVTGLGSGNQVSLNAAQSIIGILPAAGISLTDAGGGLAGTLSLSADRTAFDTAATAQAVAAAATLGDRSDALAISDGATTPGSYISAGGVQFTVGSALYAQNSGIVSTVRTDRAGVTAGAGGIRLASLGSGPVEVVLNARLTGASGDVTGQDVVGRLQLGGGETTFTFAPLSTVNGCLIDGTPCTPPVEIVEQRIQPVQDVVQQVALPSGIGQSSSYSFQNPQLIAMTGLAPATLAPLIDEPVTGAGNDNLWVGVGVSADQPLTPMGGAKSGKTPPPK